MTRNLDAAAIVSRVETLHKRIKERFPERGLVRVSAELDQIAHEAKDTAEWIARPILGLRVAILAVIILVAFLVGLALFSLAAPAGPMVVTELVQVVEAGVNDLILLGAAFYFLVSLENRLKRRKALRALHRLRSQAHIIDMHQLTKDPIRVLTQGPNTQSSPIESMTAFELTRYLDYCSEMLSFLGKIAALYVQDFDDSVALATVDEIQNLTTGLSRKIWQKIMIINAMEPLTEVRTNEQ